MVGIMKLWAACFLAVLFFFQNLQVGFSVGRVRPSLLLQRLDDEDLHCCVDVVDSMSWAVQGVQRFATSLLRSGISSGGTTSDRANEAMQVLLQIVSGRSLTLSSAFSGIATPELSARLLVSALNSHTSAPRPMTVTSIFAIEKRESCQEELLHMEHGPTCLFRDQTEFIGIDWSQITSSSSVDFVRSLILKGRVSANGWCIRHGHQCPCLKAHLHIAGTPCVDFSAMNSKRKQISGDKNKLWYAWVCHRRALMEPVWLHENVVQFGLEHLEKDLGDLYFVFRIALCSLALGWPSRRKRQFTVGILKSLFSTLVRAPSAWPYDFEHLESFVRDIFGRRFTYSMLEYCQAAPEEIAGEIEWARGRPLSLATIRGATDGDVGGAEGALIVEEHKRLVRNLAMGLRVFDVGQTPPDDKDWLRPGPQLCMPSEISARPLGYKVVFHLLQLSRVWRGQALLRAGFCSSRRGQKFVSPAKS